MSEPVSKAEVEDVLSSIRRLVSDEVLTVPASAPKPASNIRVATNTADNANETNGLTPNIGSEVSSEIAPSDPADTTWNTRFVLSPDLRIQETTEQAESPLEVPATATESPAPETDTSTASILKLVPEATNLNDIAEISPPEEEISDPVQDDETDENTTELDFNQLAHEPIAEFQDAVSPSDVPSFQRLEERAAHMEVAIAEQDNEWEPDGSDEDAQNSTMLLDRVTSDETLSNATAPTADLSPTAQDAPLVLGDIQRAEDPQVTKTETQPPLAPYVLGQEEAVAPMDLATPEAPQVFEATDHATEFGSDAPITEHTDPLLADALHGDHPFQSSTDDNAADLTTTEEAADAEMLDAMQQVSTADDTITPAQQDNADQPLVSKDGDDLSDSPEIEDIMLEAGSLTMDQTPPEPPADTAMNAEPPAPVASLDGPLILMASELTEPEMLSSDTPETSADELPVSDEETIVTVAAAAVDDAVVETDASTIAEIVTVDEVTPEIALTDTDANDTQETSTDVEDIQEAVADPEAITSQDQEADPEADERTDVDTEAEETIIETSDAAVATASEATANTAPELPAAVEASAPTETVSTATDLLANEDALRDLISDVVRQELRGPLGERITRNMRKMVRREIYRTVSARDCEN
ncbi:hypothetical protein [Halocynthiibacter namhaensis]|uniref:hypothetical protein n=1 Tax=Halocynthiibacter namhaensis TaxID=1290553 RepID=UPI00069085C0|nr:hypothetical protein [Halocynthiibacter namhaensis]